MDATIDTESAQNRSMYDVIIAGAGPVGLFLACELTLANCSVLILEKEKNPRSLLKQFPFGIRGLSAPTLEALDRRRLLDDLELHKRLKNPYTNAGKGSQRQGGHFAGVPFLDSDVDTSQWKYRLPSSIAASLISEMQELETIFARRTKVLGVEIKRGLAVTDFHQTEDPLVGHSVPNFEFEDGVRIGELMHEGQGMLLDFGSNASLKTLAGHYCDRLNYISGQAKEQFDLSAVLIRPDGIVAWAANHHPDYSEFQKAADRWFVYH